MFQVEHRKAGAAIGRQFIRAAALAEALATALPMAERLGADQLTVLDARGDFLAVFETAAV